MLEIVVSGIGGSLLQISQNSFGALDSKIPQEAAAAFPEFEVGYLDQVLHHGPRRLAPQGGGAQNGEADGPSDSGDELLPCFIVTRSGAETDHVFQRQRRIPCRSRSVRHCVLSLLITIGRAIRLIRAEG